MLLKTRNVPSKPFCAGIARVFNFFGIGSRDLCPAKIQSAGFRWLEWLWFAKTQDSSEIRHFRIVDNFVAAKAPSFNKFHQTSTRRLQTVQQESLRINRFP